jgi:hypothetical protein
MAEKNGAKGTAQEARGRSAITFAGKNRFENLCLTALPVVLSSGGVYQKSHVLL